MTFCSECQINVHVIDFRWLSATAIHIGYPTSLTMQIKDLSPLHGEMIKKYEMILWRLVKIFYLCLNDCLLFNLPSRTFISLLWRRHQLKYMAYDQRDIFILLHLLWHRALVCVIIQRIVLIQSHFTIRDVCFGGHILNQNNVRYHWTNLKKNLAM